MENTKSVKSINKKDQIVKLNKKKIIIISVIIFSLLVGLSVGLYFAFRPPRKLLPKNQYTHWVSSDEAKSSIMKDENNTSDVPVISGVYFGIENSDVSDLGLYGGAQIPDDEKTLTGPFADYLMNVNPDTNQMNWYCVNAADETENRQNIENFFHDGEENGTWAIHDSWQNYSWGGEAINSAVQFNQGSVWKGGDVKFVPVNTDAGETSTNDENVQLAFVGNGETYTFDYTMPTWLWFKNGELVAISNGLVHDTNSDTGEISLPTSTGNDGIGAEFWSNMYDATYNDDFLVKP